MKKLKIKQVTKFPHNASNYSRKKYHIEIFIIEEENIEKCFKCFYKNYIKLFKYCENISFIIINDQLRSKYQSWELKLLNKKCRTYQTTTSLSKLDTQYS